MELRVLGPLEVWTDDGPVVVAAQKERRLLAALAVAAGRHVSPDQLIDAIWGERPPTSARKLLQVYVSKLRKMMPPGAQIVTGPAGYALELEREALDSVRFEQFLADGRAALADGNAALATSLLGRALALWRGHAYADFAYEDFARTEADSLEELRLVALEEHVEARLRLGHHDEMLAELHAVTAEHPLRERLLRHLMLALYRSGRQSDALDAYQAFRALMRDELGLDPGPDLRELEQLILRQDPSLLTERAERPAGIRLPAPANRLLGRDVELSQLFALLGRSDVRLLVLTGAGGSGKTRLALELARGSAPTFANGAALVDLAPIRDSSLVIAELTRALGIKEVPHQDPLETLIAAVRPLELLLVIDNAEHLTTAAPAFVRIAAQAPRLKLVVTSRRVLHVTGEHVFPIGPLAEDHAVELFVERARALDPSFTLGDENERHVRDICRRLDGLPLAIELAAARTNMLSPSALRERLESRLALLVGGPHDLPARQHTLRNAIAWSVDLLDSSERIAFARLGVFTGAWTLEAAEAVCGAGLEQLSALVDDSLVQKRPGDRLAMLDMVREFAVEQLASSGEEQAVRRRHALYVIDVAEAGELHLGGPEQASWLARLDAEHDEIRAAERWLASAGEPKLELRLAAAIGRFRYVRAYLAEGRARLDEALAHGVGEAPALRAKACRAASAICVLQGDWRRARELCEEGLALYEQAGDRHGVARSLSNLGAILIGMEEDTAAAEVLDKAVALARDLDNARILALSLNNRGDVGLTQRDWETAASHFTESLALLRRLGDETNVVRSLFNLAAAMLETGRHDEARALLVDSLESGVRLDDREDTAWCFIAFAALAAHGDQAKEGAMLLGAAERLLEAMGAKMKPYELALHRRTVSTLDRQLSGTTLARLRSSGCDLPLSEAVELARGISST
ncbi:MAG: BTAD domain-containing putative transcriptional regulator [Actinomycetota bacterium]|nr:tetratricopeptide repeat protein [Actinomycetota bacterium]